MSTIHTPPSLPASTTQPPSAPAFIPVHNGPCHIAQVYGFTPMMPGEVLHCVGIQPGGYCSLQRIGFATMQAGVGVQQSPPQVQGMMAQQTQMQMQSYPNNLPAAFEAVSSASQVAPSSSVAHTEPDPITTVKIQEQHPDADESDELPDEEDDHSTSRSSPPPASTKRNLNVGKRSRASKATNDEMFRMAVYVANEGGERHGASKWQIFKKREENEHRTAVGWAGIYERHIEKIHEMAEEIRRAGRKSGV